MGFALYDRLQNFVSGIGTTKDKRVSNQFGLNVIAPAELSAMHRSDWLARKIVDIIPHDMTREWRNWQAKGSAAGGVTEEDRQGQIGPIEETEARLGVRQKVAEAMQKARLYGGSALVIGVDGNAEHELLPDELAKDELLYLNVLSRFEVAVDQIENNVLSPYYREPKFYNVTGANGAPAKIHPSRVIRFIGAPILDNQAVIDGWGDPVLHVVYDAVQNASASQEGIASLLNEAKVDVIKVPELSKWLETTKGTADLTRRFTYANQLKSSINMLLLEGDGTTGETWEQKQIQFAQFPDLMRLFLQVAAGAADIPVTRLLGQSPAGLNATGDSDIRNYYDNISARQEIELRPALSRLDELLIRSALGSRPPEIYYEWAPLWQLSAKEKAEVNWLNTQAAEKDAAMQLVPLPALAQARANQLIEDGVYPGLESAIAEFGTDPGTYAEEVKAEEDQMAAEMAAAKAKQSGQLPRAMSKDFDPGQPRVPAGSNIGGQWMGENSGIAGVLGKALALSPGAAMSETEAQALYDADKIPDGWYVHGRSAAFRGQEDPLETGDVIQLSKSLRTADAYAKEGGDVFYISPSLDAKTLDLSDIEGEDANVLRSAFVAAWERGTLPRSLDDAIGGIETAEEAWLHVRSSFSPSNIVDSAEWYDDRSVVAWIYDSTGIDFIVTPNGAVVFNIKKIARGRRRVSDARGASPIVYAKVPQRGRKG